MRSLCAFACLCGLVPFVVVRGQDSSEGAKTCAEGEVLFSGEILPHHLDKSPPNLQASELLVTVDDAADDTAETLHSFHLDLTSYEGNKPLPFSFCSKIQDLGGKKNFLLRVNVSDRGEDSDTFFFGEKIIAGDKTDALKIEVFSNRFEEEEAPLSIADCEFSSSDPDLMPISVVVNAHLPTEVTELPDDAVLTVEVIDMPEDDDEEMQSLAVFSGKVKGVHTPNQPIKSFLCASVANAGESYLYEIKATLKMEGNRTALNQMDFANDKIVPLVVRPDVSDYVLDVNMKPYGTSSV